jgi:hypothetical protein
VEVWGKRYTISVQQTSKTVWVASGEYTGKSLVVKDRSLATATRSWREAAEYMGN